MSTPSLIYDHGPNGWSALTIRDGSHEQRIAAISYLSDALDDLIRMGIDLATDRGWSYAVLNHEPGTTVLVAETGYWDEGKWIERTRLSAFVGRDYGEPDPTWHEINGKKRDWTIFCDSGDELASAFLEMAENVARKVGIRKYRWASNAFPVRGLRALKTALETERILIAD